MVSRTTPNIGLPQYEHGDHPDFLGEINDAYMTIDANINKLKVKGSIIEQSINSINEELVAIRKLLEGVIENGK